MFNVQCSIVNVQCFKIMLPQQNLKKFAAAVVRRSGICMPTVEQVLPAVFDEIRFQLCEAKRPCVPIDSFGTFYIENVPERQRRYTYKDKDEVRTYPPERRLKFRPAKNMKRELQQGQFDPTRRSFTRHPKDPILRRRQRMSNQEPIHVSDV